MRETARMTDWPGTVSHIISPGLRYSVFLGASAGGTVAAAAGAAVATFCSRRDQSAEAMVVTKSE